MLLLLPVLGLAGLVAGCSGGVGGADTGTGTGGGSSFWSSLGAGSKAGQPNTATGAQAAAADPDNPAFSDNDYTTYSCPKVEVRGGAAAWQLTDKSDGGLRYQASLGQISRDCKFGRPDMTMHIGIQGRVLVGSKGGPGSLNVPLRLAVVQEGPEPKTIWTKLYTVPVQIGAGEFQVDYSMVADDVTFPTPERTILDRYVVYLGFDPQAGTVSADRAAKPRATRPKPARPKPVATRPRPAAQPAAEEAASPAPATQQAPAATAPASPAPAADQQQWIGAPAPAAGTFSQ